MTDTSIHLVVLFKLPMTENLKSGQTSGKSSFPFFQDFVYLVVSGSDCVFELQGCTSSFFQHPAPIKPELTKMPR